MADEILEGIAQDIANIDKQIERAEMLLSAARDAGVEVASSYGTLSALKVQRDKWAKMLQSRNINIP